MSRKMIINLDKTNNKNICMAVRQEEGVLGGTAIILFE
jgi:hypothetical protein